MSPRRLHFDDVGAIRAISAWLGAHECRGEVDDADSGKGTVVSGDCGFSRLKPQVLVMIVLMISLVPRRCG